MMNDELKTRAISPAATAARPRACRAVARHASRAALAACLLAVCLCAVAPRASGQEVVDKMVATINGRELITYSDLLWQLALQPDTPLDRPRPQDLQQTLERLIDQRLITQEAGRLPTTRPSEKEVTDAITALISRFPSQAAFQERIGRVGLTNEQLRELVSQRIEIEKYLDFRFRAFVVVSPAEIADYYRDTYVPRFRRQQPGRIVPTLEQSSAQIQQTLIEAKVESDTDAFLEDARARAEIVILDAEFRGQKAEVRGQKLEIRSRSGS